MIVKKLLKKSNNTKKRRLLSNNGNVKKMVLKSTIVFNKKIAKSFHKTKYYYEVKAEGILNSEFLKNEKDRLATKHNKEVTLFIKNIKRWDKQPSRRHGESSTASTGRT